MHGPVKPSLKATALLIALGLASLASPAVADQLKETADGGTIDCQVSAHELTRFSLIGDGFASVSKIGTGTPYNDFAVTNEPVRGDIYVSVPEVYAAARISFFATTKKGYVYKFACPIKPVEAQQVFITNPAIAKTEASDWESATPIETSAVRLVQAMAAQAQVSGFSVRQASGLPSRAGPIEVQLIAEYRGASLAGKVIRLANRGDALATIAERDLAPLGALAVAIANPVLEPGAATTAYIVGQAGENGHD
jgi:conjugal transfer pilus assembly protein TraK